MSRRTTNITNLCWMDESVESTISEPDSAAVTTSSSDNHVPSRANYIQLSSNNTPNKTVKQTQSLTNSFVDHDFGAPTFEKIQSNLEKCGFGNSAEHRSNELSKPLLLQNDKAFSNSHQTQQTLHTISSDIRREKMTEKDSELVKLFFENSIFEQSITEFDERREADIALMIAKKMEQEDEDLKMAMELSQTFAIDDDALYQKEKNDIELENDLQLSNRSIKPIQYRHSASESLSTRDEELETTLSLSNFATHGKYTDTHFQHEDNELELAIRLSKSSHQPSELDLEEKRQLELALKNSLYQH